MMRVESDFLVFGSGIAGLTYALKAAELGKVCIITKSTPETSATAWAQGGIASVFSKDDSFEKHIEDTRVAGAGLCNEAMVKITVEEGPARVRELIQWGVPFSKNSKNGDESFEYDLTKEGGHTERRILHSNDFTGFAIEKTLLEKASKHPNITFYNHHVAIDLITNVTRLKAKHPERVRMPEKIRALGMYVLDSKTGLIHSFHSPVIVLATGGAGKVYLYTTNPDVSTGDGIAIGYRAGARVANMEFIQFHPTCLFHPDAKSFLISEALRGEGGILVTKANPKEDFVKKTHPMGSLAPRDIVARAIDTEMKRSGEPCVFLDMTHHSRASLQERFPNIFEQCLKYGIDISTTPIPVVPSAHYTCGGLLTNEFGETSIENLFAIGEVACTGLHGANRLASNSLLEGTVFAHRAVEKAKEILSYSKKRHAAHLPEPLPEWDHGRAVPMEERINIDHTWREIRTLMWNYVGIVRSNSRLEKAKARLALIRNDVQEYYWNYLLNTDLIELRNLITVASLIVECALSRKESRGLHYSLDYPNKNDLYFKRDTII